MALAIHTRRPTSFTHSSSAWTCCRSTRPCWTTVLMHPLAVLARAGQPGGHGALIDPEGRHDGLGRTAVAQQGQDERHHVRAPSATGRRACLWWPRRSGHRWYTDSAAPAWLCTRMFPCPTCPLAGHCGLWQNWVLRVHRWPPLRRDLARTGKSRPKGCPKDPRFFKPSDRSPRLTGVVPKYSDRHKYAV